MENKIYQSIYKTNSETPIEYFANVIVERL